MNKNYDTNFYVVEKEASKNASDILIPYVIERLNCRTVIDFGCGVGECLNAAKKCTGIEKVMGLDGEWVREHLKIEEDEFLGCDLSQKIDLKEKYDLAISLEVAEHLPEESAKIFISNLVRHADVVLFSAAVPYQGGTHHVNEKYPSYWEKLFSELDFSMCDCIRNRFWNDGRIANFYRQNTFIYCKNIMQHEILEIFKYEEKLTDIIHPDYWKDRNAYSYMFPFDKVEHNARVIVYCAGKVGKIFVNQLLATGYAELVLWCDKAFEDFGIDISDPQKIKEVQFDNLIIAIEKEKIALEIMDYLIKMGVPNEKIIWRMPKFRNRY